MNKSELNYFVLIESLEKIKEAIIYGEWNGKVSTNSQLTEMQRGDILLFYSLEPINGLVGFATIRNKTELNDSGSKIEFERNYCLPFLLWKEQKINFNNFNTTNIDINWLDNNEEITRISNLINLKWGTELKSRIESEILEKPLFYRNKCLECGKEIDSKIAKYCVECRIKVRKKQALEWNKKNIDRIREAGKRWRKNHPDKVKEYYRRWKEAHPDKVKELRGKWREKKKSISILEKKDEEHSFLTKKEISDWCRELRSSSAHLLWMRKQKKRREKIAEIENKFNCYWEDKFKEIFENYKHEDAAKILNLNYRSLCMWAKHLKLQRVCIYCQKELAISKGNFHPECKDKYGFEQKNLGIKELFTLIDPAINIDILDLNSDNIMQVLKDILSMLPERESFIIENRYLNYNFKNRKTLEEIGSILGITRERVRQLERGAINKLSHPSRLKLIREKLTGTLFKEKGILESLLSKKISELQIELNKLREKLGMDQKQEIVNMPSSEIKLSVRATNCLRNIGIKTLGELANKTESEMLSIRNLGERTLWELREALHSYGLKFKNETIFLISRHDENNPLIIKKKCLFVGCNVTPHKGEYCSKHKTTKHTRTSILRKKGKSYG